MFSNLVESGSHAADLRRRGTFFVGTLAFYGLLLAATGVGSIYAYNASVGAQSDYEVLAILRFQPEEARSQPARPDAPRPAASAARPRQIATRPEISINTPYFSHRIAEASTREVSARTPVVISPVTSDPEPGGLSIGPNLPGGHGHSNTTGNEGPRVSETTPPPPVPVRPAATPAPRQNAPIHLSTSVLNGKAVQKPIPAYPPAAKQAGIQGTVTVQIQVDEQGRVVSARATSGHPLLLLAAVQSARQARFTPTLLNGQPVKVAGVITYNFTLQ